ncbi:hypothetical protein LWI29_021600 [Acer saccharum]|uniref:DUF7894 domain-containing protein n=1 Tax=Acer saccharum TaxID=4024 RepID=A0AA39TG55_ACESA|nr:hypothetical protein LWI29_021600 [Acer saccharum]
MVGEESFELSLHRYGLKDEKAFGQLIHFVDDDNDHYHTLYNIRELLASNTGMCFSRDKIKWNPNKTSKYTQEPWLALYG